ncbi:MAG: carboxypeptidase-like regulatory domain-containing protein, partial [Bacteroidetes bacterium]|nr:carboxypeptidase-like regulatory domain-containing protein [Bacteroidota bacterium]
VVRGKVCDFKTREALPGVVIYLDGTSVVTTSDADGNFLLEVEKRINANLVFSHLSYESLVVENPFEHVGEVFFLKEKSIVLNAAVVVADYDPYRTERMRIFKKFFLGESVAANSCVIHNEDDILLRYDNNTATLHASSRNPLVVENRHLGYRIHIDIQYFQVKYTYASVVPPSSSTAGSISSARAQSIDLSPSSFSYKINYFFEDENPYDVLLSRRRNDIYERSRQYFWSSLIANFALKESGFKIYNRSKEVDAREYFSVLDIPTRGEKMVTILPNTDIDRRHKEVFEGTVYGVMGIRAKNKNDSQVIFLTHQFSVDPFGNITDSGLVYEGDMSQQRIGDMLPRDFVYAPFNVPRRRR